MKHNEVGARDTSFTFCCFSQFDAAYLDCFQGLPYSMTVAVNLYITANARQPKTDSRDCYFEYLIAHYDYLIIPFDYLIAR